MWWETIPPSLVIMAALTVGLYNSAGLHLLMFGVVSTFCLHNLSVHYLYIYFSSARYFGIYYLFV